MRVYTLSNPSRFEKNLLRSLAGSEKQYASWKKFRNGEIFARVFDVERQVCVIGRTEPPAENFLSTLILVDALRQSGAKDITLLIPYFGYSRQDRQVFEGDSVAGSMMLDAFACVGVAKIVTLDFHSASLQKSSPIPIVSQSFIPEQAAALKKAIKDGACAVVAPDRGSRSRALFFAEILGIKNNVAWMEKKRDRNRKVAGGRLHGRIKGKIAILVDDMLDTGSTIVMAAGILREAGFQEFYLCITHPIFSGSAISTIQKLKFKKILTANTIPFSGRAKRLLPISVLDAKKALVGAVLRGVDKLPRAR